MFNFENQRVVVTGGTRGIGKGIALAFLKAGADVIATYEKNKDAAEAFKAECSEFGDKLQVSQCNVTDPTIVDSFFKSLDGRIDVLINNSGIRADGLVPMMSIESWENVIKTNLTGTFIMSKHAVLLMMKKRYGRIVNISSIAGRIGLPGQGNYSATKEGQIAFSKSLAKEVGKRNITVNNVAPGFIDTDFIKDLPEELIKTYKDSVPLKRFGTVEDVANAVLFLASKEASYITGATIEVSGGL